MVFTISNHNNCLADVFLLAETAHRKVDGLGDVGSLCGDECWVDVLQEHFRRNIVGGDGQLHEGVAGKHHKPYAVVCEVVYKVLDKQFTFLQARWHHVLCHHRVADVYGNDGLYAVSFVVGYLRTHLRTSQHHHQKGKGSDG